ncbi:MAG: hypothetical protein HQM10_06630 [Candidatus Riflebacteria bacterium]|nr:hypothetical protein [Candidatus Riflebacteria bacterium]
MQKKPSNRAGISIFLMVLFIITIGSGYLLNRTLEISRVFRKQKALIKDPSDMIKRDFTLKAR